MLKNRASTIWKQLGIALILSMSGCAAAYHDYHECCFPYLYCPSPPLPYVAYEGCHCPTPGTSLSSQQQDVSTSASRDSDVPTLSEQEQPAAAVSW